MEEPDKLGKASLLLQKKHFLAFLRLFFRRGVKPASGTTRAKVFRRKIDTRTRAFFSQLQKAVGPIGPLRRAAFIARPVLTREKMGGAYLRAPHLSGRRLADVNIAVIGRAWRG
jgi:hypothetical protein